MGENTAIEWAHHTFNPWMGCTKVSEACRHCYAERDMDHRYGKVAWGRNGTRVVTSAANWKKPLKWNRDAEEAGERRRVFCASLADVFEDWRGPIHRSQGGEMGYIWHGPRKQGPDAMCTAGEMLIDPFHKTVDGGPVIMSGYRHATMDDLRAELFRLIDATPHLDWLLLTKRPERVLECWPKNTNCVCPGVSLAPGAECDHHPSCPARGCHRENVWLGTSVENQQAADERVPHLLRCRELAPVLFLSCEPLLEQVDLTGVATCDIHRPDGVRSYTRPLMDRDVGEARRTVGYTVQGGVDWIIAGGESGPHARPSHPAWFRSLRGQCQAAGVPFLFKQWGEWMPACQLPNDAEIYLADELADRSDVSFARVGSENSGCTLDGKAYPWEGEVKS